ncbi:MAG: hypothetical protein P4L64_16350 [Caulobacteraceae bacterium]|nr:hypothetical protein [Caulobacteraceae bacterium]
MTDFKEGQRPMGVEVPYPVRGLWVREVITAPGFRDETTRVMWLQGPSWYADLRVAIDRPERAGAEGFAAYADDELVAMARVQGFAGQLRVEDGICYWRRDVDFQPPSPFPDEGRYSVTDDIMIEDGIHADYQEIWRRAPDSIAPAAAFQRLDEDGRAGLLVIAGGYMIEFVARAGERPEGESLAHVVEAALAAGDRARAEDLLSTCIRFAERGVDGAWITTLSSLPWLQGRPVWAPGAARFDAEAGLLTIGLLTSGLGSAPDRWRLLEASAPLGEILGWLGALEDSTLGVTP